VESACRGHLWIEPDDGERAWNAALVLASSRPGLISDGVSPRAIRFIARLHSARIAVYAAAVLLAPWLTIGSIALFAAATVIFGLPNPFLERRLAELGLT
jgi:hypothetical protein